MNQSTQDKWKHLLDIGPNHTEDEYWAAAAKFTNACCYDERFRYRMIRKTGGRKCFNPSITVDCDKVAEMTTGKMFDMVVGAGRITQQAGFGEQEGFCNPADFVMPYELNDNPNPNPIPQPDTVPWQSYWGDNGSDKLKNTLAFDYGRRPQSADFDVIVWASRTFHSAYMGPDKTPLGLESAIEKHRPEWCAALGVPVIPFP